MSLPLFFFLAGWLLYRTQRARRGPGYVPIETNARKAILVFLGAVAALEVYGVARGGSIDQSFWQILKMFTMPLVILFLLGAVRGKQDLRAYGNIIVLVAVVRGLIVAWVYFVVCGQKGIVPEYCTTHGDSVTFVAAFFVLLANFVEAQNKRALARLIVVGAWLLAVMVMNNRRLAFVGLGLGAVTMYVCLPTSGTKRKLTRAMVVLAPLFAVYLYMGADSDAPLYMPARLAMSALRQEDTSADSRDIENANLVFTIERNPILGPGFGFEYVERIENYDISNFLAFYKYTPHNAVLWLWSVGGLVGFVVLWAPFVALTYFAARGYRFARTPIERSATLACVGISFVCIMMDWGDQGLTNYTNWLVFSVAYAIAAKVCVQAEREKKGYRSLVGLLRVRSPASMRPPRPAMGKPARKPRLAGELEQPPVIEVFGPA
jgi:hypothetical protein